MHFTEATNEVFNWFGSHPGDAVFCALTVAAAVVLATKKYKDERAADRKAEEIVNSVPPPRRVVVKDGKLTLE